MAKHIPEQVELTNMCMIVDEKKTTKCLFKNEQNIIGTEWLSPVDILKRAKV